MKPSQSEFTLLDLAGKVTMVRRVGTLMIYRAGRACFKIEPVALRIREKISSLIRRRKIKGFLDEVLRVVAVADLAWWGSDRLLKDVVSHEPTLTKKTFLQIFGWLTRSPSVDPKLGDWVTRSPLIASLNLEELLRIRESLAFEDSHSRQALSMRISDRLESHATSLNLNNLNKRGWNQRGLQLIKGHNLDLAMLNAAYQATNTEMIGLTRTGEKKFPSCFEGQVVVLHIPRSMLIGKPTDQAYALAEFLENVAQHHWSQGELIVPKMQLSNSHCDTSKNYLNYAYHCSPRSMHKTLVYKESAIPGRYHLNTKGYSGWASEFGTEVWVTRNAEESLHFRKLVADYKSNTATKYQQATTEVNEVATNSSKKLLFTTQIIYDSVTEHFFIDWEKALEETVKWSMNHDFSVLIKRHPLCESQRVEATIRRVAASSPHVYVTQDNPKKLIRKSDILVTGNSGTALEALAMDVPVVCFGKNEFLPSSRVAKNVSGLVDELDSAAMGVSRDKNITLGHEVVRAITCSSSDPNFYLDLEVARGWVK